MSVDKPALKGGFDVTTHMNCNIHVLQCIEHDAIWQACCIARTNMKMWQLYIFTPELQPS